MGVTGNRDRRLSRRTFLGLGGMSAAALLQSDDNFSTGQVTRVVALGVENEQLPKGR